MDVNFKSNMQSKSHISFSDDLEDSFVEIFRSCQNSVSQNVSGNNGEQKRKELSVRLTQKDMSVNTNVPDESRRVNENDSTSKLNELCNLLKNNVIQQCPICFKKNSSDQITGFLAHLKGCASKHKVTTEQLIKAVQLIEKQASERTALGLPKITNEKTVKKNYSRKVGMDSNMQLAVALSASLRESEFFTKLKETETLIEAGLEQEVAFSYKQLEDFGFKTSKQTDTRPTKANSRSKNRNTILFSRSQAERERIITEKVAIILIDSNGQNSDCALPATSNYFRLKSKFLRSIRYENCEVWKKSFQSNEEAPDHCYYLENLSSFISPCKVKVGTKLKHISQIPGRSSSDENRFSRSLQDLIEFFRPTSKEDPPKSTTKFISSLPVLRKPKISRSLTDYKSLVNNKFMSDITIYVKCERSIYAHKLIFYARCGAILADSIAETENGKTSEIIMWLEYCYESVIAFLEYVYADTSDSVYQLDDNQLSDLSALCTRYHVNDLRACVDELTLKEPSTSTSMPADENFHSHLAADQNLDCHLAVDKNFDSCLAHSSACSNASTRSPSPINGEQNLEFLQMALATQNDQPSPEMFVDSDAPVVEENDFSLSIHDSSPSARCTPVNSVDSKKCGAVELSQKSLRVGEKIPQWTCDTDVICLSDDDEFVGIAQDLDQPQDVSQTNAEKRKAESPLLLSPVKKPIPPAPNKSQPGIVRRKKLTKKPTSQYTLSDSFESSDSDESLYKIKTNIGDSSPECSFSANLSQRSSKALKLPQPAFSANPSPRSSKALEQSQPDKLTGADSSFELDDFRDPVPEIRNFNGSVEGCHSKSPTELNSGAKADASYVSPIWDGFDDYHDNYFHTNFSPSPVAAASKFSTPVKNRLTMTKSLVSPLSSRTYRHNSPADRIRTSSGTPDVPTFDSFSLDESVLTKLESKLNVPKVGALTQIATPSDVRKFQARSKSDTFLTPSPRGNGRGTPMADYSGMKTVELKRELDKYGLKPGLAKGKAKQLLRHIYEQLHPGEVKPEEKQKPKRTRKNSARSKKADGKLAAVSADTDETSDSFASGIEELEASFADDGPNVDNDEGSKSQKVSIESGFKSLLREDKELHNQILLYEPIWLDELKIKLKEKNVKCSSSTLMNYLDEKCITFRTRNQRRVRTKKKKIKSSAESSAT